MTSRAFLSSAILHGVVLTLMAFDFSFARFENTPPPPAVLMIDLKKVQIADKTNLPPKVQVKPKKETPKKQPPKPTPPPAKTKPTKTVHPNPEPAKPLPAAPKKDAAPVVAPKPADKPKEKKAQTKSPPEPKPQKPSADDRLKSLLTSVESVRKNAPTPTPAETETKTENLTAGLEGDLNAILTISERDLIAHQLSQCWNLDAGKKDIENITIEIRAQISKDGSVRDVQILNKALNAVHQSVADSARRAVWICNGDPDKSPFKILAEKYADHYADWKSVTLRFNPITGVH